jgi:hypothetical protein
MYRPYTAVLAVILTVMLSLIGRAALAAPAVPKEAVCAICGPREGAGPEPVRATVEHQGTTYYFCQESCKAEFQQDPARWIKLAREKQPKADPPGSGHSSREGGSEVPS